MSGHLKLQTIKNDYLQTKMVKENISRKQKGIYYPPEIKYFVFDTDPAWGDDEE